MVNDWYQWFTIGSVPNHSTGRNGLPLEAFRNTIQMNGIRMVFSMVHCKKYTVFLTVEILELPVVYREKKLLLMSFFPPGPFECSSSEFFSSGAI